ncbi:MAG: hypothetical protein K8S62_01400 [Candidatus Sabulitectum sp.]|nr:hypothetical protein [Candidatus Sabulitectum sp.]
MGLDPEVFLDDTISMMIEASDLAFTLESVTRCISILGWASERYDLEVGEVLKGDLQEDMVSFFVFPESMYSRQLSFMTEGSGVVVFAFADSTHSCMEGFSIAEGDRAVSQIYIRLPIEAL